MNPELGVDFRGNVAVLARDYGEVSGYGEILIAAAILAAGAEVVEALRTIELPDGEQR